MDIRTIIATHGKSKVRALINLHPLHVYCGLIAITSTSDNTLPVLCEVDEKRYTVEEGYKIGWTPIKEYAPKGHYIKLHECNGFASETFYQSDFNSLVDRGDIKVYIEA